MSDEYDVFSFKSTTWWFLAIFCLVWYSAHSKHNSSSHSMHQLTDVLTTLLIWQGPQIVAVAMVNSINIKIKGNKLHAVFVG
jgi:hypothetical protein